jgi:hypothetical protein
MTRLTDRQLGRLAWASWWFFTLALLSRAVLAVVDVQPNAGASAEAGAFLVVVMAFPLAGLLILRKQPRNHVGWLLACIGLVWGFGGYGDTYASYGLSQEPAPLPGAGAAAAIANIIWAPALGLTGTFLFLLFPDGRLPSNRWRPVAWLSGAVVGALTLCLALSPGELTEGPGAGLVNPLGIASLESLLEVVVPALILLLAVCIMTSAVGLVTRFRRAHGIERLQLKWLASAAAAVGSVFLLGIATSATVTESADAGWQGVIDQLSFMLFALLPLAIVVAILRYRLYDIDVVVNRALVYGTLTATLVATYLGSVLLLQLLLRPLTERSDLAVAASTLAVAGLFGPARRRIQVAVDRRFYRHRYDAARTVADFSTRLRHGIDLDAVGDDLLAAVRETVQPTVATVWLSGARSRP